MQCGRCRGEADPALKTCAACGAPLAPPCPSCGGAVAPADRFCAACGTALTGTATARRALPEHLARKILTTREALAGERKQVTVLFADITDSLTLLVDRDPEDARTFLDAVLKRMMEAVHRFEGTVNQVMGDGIMALFGAPLAHEDHAVRACYAALRMHHTVGRYAQELAGDDGPALRIRVGLNSGEVVVRSIDNDLHIDYSAVGQTTHLAARMEQLARPGTTLITEATRRLAEHHVVVQPLGALAVKGFASPVEAYELRGGRDAGAPVPRDTTPLLGRERELDRLQQLAAMAESGAGQVVFVVGDPGIGKSRLIAELVASCHGRGWATLEGAGIAYGRGTPYLPFVVALKQYFGVVEDDDVARIQVKVRGKLAPLDAALPRTVPAVLALGSLPVDDPAWNGLEPAERRQRIFAAVREILLLESVRQPMLLVIENIHLVDAESLALLDLLAEAVGTARVLLVVSARPDGREGVPWQRGVRIDVDALSPAATTAFLESLLGAGADLAALKRLLLARTDGNPFFLEESVRALADAGVLVGERGAYRLDKPLRSIQIPSRVQAVVAARVDALPSTDKSLLQAAAVIGKDVPVSLLEAVSGVEGDELMRSLGDLETGGFLAPTGLFPDVCYAFRHALTHEVVYASLLREQRRLLHGRVLDALKLVHRQRQEEHVERLADHAHQAERWQEAVPYLREAAAKAVMRAANVEAIAFLEQALKALRHFADDTVSLAHAIDTRLELVSPLLQLGRLDDVLTLTKEAEALAEDTGDGARLARVYAYLVNYHYLRGEPVAALAYGERCLALPEGRGDARLAALARRYMAHSYHAQGDYARAIARLEDSLTSVATPSQPDAAVTTAHVAAAAWLAFGLAEIGEFDAAQTWGDRARDLAGTREHPYPSAIAWTMAGLVATARGDLGNGTYRVGRALELCREANLAVWLPIASALLGQALALSGRAAEALSLLEDAVRQSEALGVHAYLARWYVALAEGRLAGGDAAGARADGEHARALARTHGERGHEAYALRLLGDATARSTPPDAAAALAHYREALALAEPLGMRPLVARLHLGIGAVLRAIGDGATGAEHLAPATVMLSELGMGFWLEHAAREVAGLGGIVVVARSHRALYESLLKLVGGETAMRMILDRRRGDRRQRDATTGTGDERRRRDRRRAAVDEQLRARGLALTGAATP
ncbi:MAG TPA: adenylate/guanylate cyclase domain-containing protein [Methylomirabilota bacterium]